MAFCAVVELAQVYVAGIREEFAAELQQAEAAAEAAEAAIESGELTVETIEADDGPEMQEFLSLKQQYSEALQEMGEWHTLRGLK
jgi:hypothetical protein